MSDLPSERAAPLGPAAATTSATLLMGGLWTTTTRLVPQLYLLAVSIAAARFLGPEDFGRQSFIAFVELSLISLLSAGFTTAFMRYVGESLGASRPEAVRELIRWAWRIEALAAALGGGSLLAAAILGAEPQAAWVFAAIACALGLMHTVPSALLIGAQRWRDASIVGLVTGAFGTAAAVIVLAAGGGITGMFVVEAAIFGLNLIWTTVLARRALSAVAPSGAGLAHEAWHALRRRVWRYALPATYGVVLTLVLWRRSEFVFLESYSTETQLALYSIVFAVMMALGKLPEAISAVAFPAVATLFGAGETERIRIGFARSVRLVLLLALPITAAVLAFGPELIRLVYGDAFREAGPVLLIMAAAFPVIPLLQLSGSLLGALGLLRFQLIVETGAAALDVGLAFVLVPDHGAIGAAIASTAAQVTASILIFAYALRVIGPPQWLPLSLSRAALASLAAGLAGWAPIAFLGGAQGLVIGLATGTLLFVALAVTVRIIPAEDAAWLEGATEGRLGSVVAFVCRHCA